MKRILAAFAAVMVLAGCADEPKTMREEAVRELEAVWEQQDSKSQGEVCLAWLIMPEALTEDILYTTEGKYLFPSDVEKFFDKECRDN